MTHVKCSPTDNQQPVLFKPPQAGTPGICRELLLAERRVHVEFWHYQQVLEVLCMLVRNNNPLNHQVYESSENSTAIGSAVRNNHDICILPNTTAIEMLLTTTALRVPSNHQGCPQKQRVQGTNQHVVYQHEESALLPQRSS